MGRVYLWRTLANIELARSVGATHLVEYVSAPKRNRTITISATVSIPGVQYSYSH